MKPVIAILSTLLAAMPALASAQNMTPEDPATLNCATLPATERATCEHRQSRPNFTDQQQPAAPGTVVPNGALQTPGDLRSPTDPTGPGGSTGSGTGSSTGSSTGN